MIPEILYKPAAIGGCLLQSGFPEYPFANPIVEWSLQSIPLPTQAIAWQADSPILQASTIHALVLVLKKAKSDGLTVSTSKDLSKYRLLRSQEVSGVNRQA